MMQQQQQQQVSNGNNNRIVAVNVTPSGTPSPNHDSSKLDQVSLTNKLLIFRYFKKIIV